MRAILYHIFRKFKGVCYEKITLTHIKLTACIGGSHWVFALIPLQLQRDDVHDGGGGGRQLSYGERNVARPAAARSIELEVILGFFPVAAIFPLGQNLNQ